MTDDCSHVDDIIFANLRPSGKYSMGEHVRAATHLYGTVDHDVRTNVSVGMNLCAGINNRSGVNGHQGNVKRKT